jgi:hypothetical protein
MDYNDSMAKNQTTKKEHWLPQASHLAQFADDAGVVQVYRFTEKSKTDFVKTANHFPSSASGVGFENGLYERPDLPVNTIENNLAKIESDFGRVLEKKIKPHKSLTDKDRAIVAEYIGLLQFRTPHQREHWNSFLDKLDLMSKQIALAHNSPSASDKISAEVKEAKRFTFTDAMAIAQDVGIWHHLDYCFITIPDTMREAEFITGDHPVSLTDFTQAGLNSFCGSHPWHKTAESVVPLTPSIALFGNRVGITGYKEADYNYVREINQRTLSHSPQMVISKTAITEHECTAMIRRYPQSLILKYMELPDGRADEIIKQN